MEDKYIQDGKKVKDKTEEQKNIEERIKEKMRNIWNN